MSMIASADTTDPKDEGASLPAQPDNSTAVTGNDGADPVPKRRRGRWAVVAVAAAAAAATGIWALAIRDSGTDEDVEAVTIRAVTAEQRDLIEFTDLDGTLGYARTTTVAATVPGTITAVADDGQALERGHTAYEIDAQPVTVFYGSVPLYRPLIEGDEGSDVELLEANLASLGYHLDQDADDLADGDDEEDTGFTVDGVFDAATTEAVLRWQEDLGIAETGSLELGQVIVTDGPAVVSAVEVEVGSVVQAGMSLMELNQDQSVQSFHSAHAGELELVATAGPVDTGQVLYSVDDTPVTAVVTEETFDRDLSEGVAPGDDVRALEELLVTLGHDARGDLEPDDEFDEITTEAIESWQEELADTWDAVAVDGRVTPESLVVIPDGVSVEAVTDSELLDGKVVATGSELFTWSSGQGRIVTTAIEVSEQDKLVEGAEVDVEFPDGTVVVGTVTDVATASTLDAANPEAAAELAVEISVTQVPDSVAGLSELDVTVKLVENLAADVVVVPASALAPTADGGYAVEIVEGVATTFVPVEPGMFADGFVEVDGISAGTAVVVPS